MYRYVDAALIRAAAYPSGLTLAPLPPESGDAATDTEHWRHWIGQIWAQQPVAEAIELASPVLARHLHNICTGEVRHPRQVRRSAFSLHRYLLRWQYRSTPFGLFAGIAPARIGDSLTLRWGDGHRPTARVDAVWLTEVITRLETCPGLLRRLPVTADSTCSVRDERLLVPCQQPAHDSRRGPGEVSMRYTRAVKTVMSAATAPVTVADLAGKLAADYPDTPAGAIEALLAELVARRVLISALRPPMTVTDPLGHVLDQLDAADAETITAVAPTVRALREIRTTLTRHTTAPAEQRQAMRASVIEAMTAQTSVVEQPLSVDLRLDCSMTLPHQVAREAEKAATALARLTPFPSGSPAWQDYHARFLERYGTGALVPVAQLTDPDAGLDFPAGYRGSLLARQTPTLTGRDEQLVALAQRAAFDGTREVHLTEEALTELEHGPADLPLPHADLRFHLQAPTRQALAGGDFTLVVNGVTPAAGASSGRFLDLLDAADRDRMTAAYTRLPTLEAAAIRAQVSSPPLHVRTENVARAPALGPHLISVAEHPEGPTLPLHDLAVTADATRLSLVQLSTGRTVEPVALNAVDLSTFTHPLARLLCELPRSRAAAFAPFAWGAAARMPFLPRVRHGRAVLVPASWRITATELPGPDATLAQWTESLGAWRRRFGLTGAVHLGDDDKRLRLDLDRSTDAALLRAKLERAGHATVREAPDATAYGWFNGRAHEITLALASTRTPLPRRATPRAAVGRDHGHLPGASPWAYLKLYGPPDRVPAILTQHLPRLFDGWDDAPQWWFLRYRDPHDHLRLRFRLPHPQAFGDVAARAGAWAADLRQRGLLGRMQWDTYYPETGRFGTGEALAAAETVFAVDSAAVLAQLTFTAHSGAHLHAVATASLVDLVVSFTGDAPAAMRWLIDHIDTRTAPHPTRLLHTETMRLANPRGGFANLRGVPGGERLVAAWVARRSTLENYRSVLAADSRSPESVLPSLMHLHFLRTAGIDKEGEDTCSRLARSTALAWRARTEGAPA
ncbi:lantibiotic dehydratase [Streptomyces graminilatus]|uniref:lantibiotic dehydratase n=1 Tax=Streptomyces graminilatus TaxID=1464070 RepID=UPI0007C7F010|nr:lantibiotic dehydratase [Streptomyces graminilatus]